MVYSVQGRTGVNVEPATLERLAEIDNIIGVKEASGNIAQMAAVIQRVPERFAMLSGDDAITIPVTALGGTGVISVVSNEIPGEMTELAQAALRGDLVEARRLQRRFLPLMEVNFIESNPIPVMAAMAAMAAMGLLQPVGRLPMCAPSPANEQRIRSILESLGLMEAANAG